MVRWKSLGRVWLMYQLSHGNGISASVLMEFCCVCRCIYNVVLGYDNVAITTDCLQSILIRIEISNRILIEMNRVCSCTYRCYILYVVKNYVQTMYVSYHRLLLFFNLFFPISFSQTDWSKSKRNQDILKYTSSYLLSLPSAPSFTLLVELNWSQTSYPLYTQHTCPSRLSTPQMALMTHNGWLTGLSFPSCQSWRILLVSSLTSFHFISH